MNYEIEYKIENKKLKLIRNEVEKLVIFDFPIRQVIKFHDCFVVRLEPDIGQIYNENVFGISHEGKILWQIESISLVYEDSPYTGIGKEGEKAKLCNWDGTDLLIDPYTGKIIKKSFSK